MSAIEKTRSEWVYELQHIMKTHSITSDLAIKALAKLYNITWEMDGADELALFSKGLMKSGVNKIDSKKLFKGLEADTEQLKLGFSTEPIGTEATLKLAENLKHTFVPDEKITPEQIKVVADRHFHGDTGAAKYFIIFEYLFPKQSLITNKKWNQHFGITHKDSNKWDKSGGVPDKFYKLYLKKDIGILLTGLYLFIKDSVNLKQKAVFCSKPRVFFVNWTQWYDEAIEVIKENKVNKRDPKISL